MPEAVAVRTGAQHEVEHPLGPARGASCSSSSSGLVRRWASSSATARLTSARISEVVDDGRIGVGAHALRDRARAWRGSPTRRLRRLRAADGRRVVGDVADREL